MTTHSAFLDYVLPHVPGCTNEMAILEIKNTIIDFCEKTLILQADHDPVTTIAGTVDYDLDPPSNTLVVKIMRMWFKGNALDARAPDTINTPSIYNQNSGALVETADPRFYIQKDPRSFSLYPVPVNTDPLSLTLRVALKPTRSTSTIDDLIYEEYAEIIGHGATSRLFASLGKPYSSSQQSAMNYAQYMAGVNMARDRALKGYVRSSKQVQLRTI